MHRNQNVNSPSNRNNAVQIEIDNSVVVLRVHSMNFYSYDCSLMNLQSDFVMQSISHLKLLYEIQRHSLRVVIREKVEFRPQVILLVQMTDKHNDLLKNWETKFINVIIAAPKNGRYK